MSARNNEERLGAVRSESSPAPSSNVSDPLNFIVPTMHVDLPSRGRYYPEDHPLHNQDSIEIRFMTAKDEDILTSPNLIKKGIVLNRLIQNLIVDKSIKVEDILLGDKNAILIQARISGYGPWYEVSIDCPSCDEKQEEEYNLEECTVLDEGNVDLEDVTLLDNGNISVKLPNTKLDCELKFLSGTEEKEILKNIGNPEGPEGLLSLQMKLTVKSVNGHMQREVIDYFIENMPIPDARALRKAYDQVNPNAKLKANFNCRNCDYKEDVEVPLTVNFFWPNN
tara:strand:+ start:7831 stop:8673 length:843 start_codon:yes stop_codon:yes gene_type:complete